MYRQHDIKQIIILQAQYSENHDESNELIRVKIVNSVELLLVYDRKNNIFGNC